MILNFYLMSQINIYNQIDSFKAISEFTELYLTQDLTEVKFSQRKNIFIKGRRIF